jgi:hypothetical protein
VAILGTLVVRQQAQRRRLASIEVVQEAMRAMESQALYRAALRDVPTTAIGYAVRIEREWFEFAPQNLLVAGDCPWIDQLEDVGPEMFNPRHIIADEHHAGFWYNPHRGIIRARVPELFTAADTLALYNLVNGTHLRLEQVDMTHQHRCHGSRPVDTPRAQITGPDVHRDFGSRTGPRNDSRIR